MPEAAAPSAAVAAERWTGPLPAAGQAGPSASAATVQASSAVLGSSALTPVVPGVAALTAATPNQLVATVMVRAAQLLDSLGTWLSGLPANPVTDFLSGALLLVRRTLLPGVPEIPQVRVTDTAVVEGGGGTSAVFTVNLERAYDAAVTVGYATTSSAGTLEGTSVQSADAGVDYTSVAGTLTFAPGQTVGQISVAILDDTVVESTEEFGVSIFATIPAGGALPGAAAQVLAASVAAVPVTVTGVELASAVGTIFNDDAPSSVSSADVDLSKWMSTLPGVADLPLTELPIPGTHDAGSYGITKDSPWALTGLRDFGAVLSLIGGKLAQPAWWDPIGYGLAYALDLGLRDYVSYWGKTQPTDLFTQFSDGIRYVDLRLSNEPDGTIYIEHALRGPTVDEVLADIKRFAEARPDEVLFIDMHRFTNFNPQVHAALLDKIQQTLGPRLAPDTLGTSATLRDFWEADRNIVLIYHDAGLAAENTDLWSDGVLFEPWAAANNVDDLLAKNRDFLKESVDRYPTAIWALSGTVTPDAETHVANLENLWDLSGVLASFGWFTQRADSIESLMRQVHPVLQDWLRNEFRDSINLVTTDWYNAQWARGSFVRDVLASVDGAYL